VEHDASVEMYTNLCRELAEASADAPAVAAVHFIGKSGGYGYAPVTGGILPSHNEMCSLARQRGLVELPVLMRADESFVFSLLQGRDGEDGRIQGVGEFFGLDGSFGSVEIASLGMNKWIFAALAERVSGGRVKSIPSGLVRVPRSSAQIDEAVRLAAGAACVMKPNRQGGSFGVRTFENIDRRMVERYLDEFEPFDSDFLVQKRVVGRELTCGCLQDMEQIVALDVVEVKTKSGLFGYDAKWGGEPYDLVSLPDDQNRRLVEDVSIDLMRVFSIHTTARFDYILASDGLYLLEVNTVPGMSAKSIYPAMLKRQRLRLIDLLSIARRNEAHRRLLIAQRDAAIARWSMDGSAAS
jgi:D-alanine-D-alanine ligase